MKNLAILFLSLFFACGTAKETKEEKVNLKDQVMAVHDEVMPKMGELRSVQKQLVMKAGEEGLDSLTQMELTQIADKIDEANESMMVWMRNFNPQFEGSEEAMDAYLKDQLKSIELVKTDMMGALAEGQEALK
jgi:hypothetical protein